MQSSNHQGFAAGRPNLGFCRLPNASIDVGSSTGLGVYLPNPGLKAKVYIQMMSSSADSVLQAETDDVVLAVQAASAIGLCNVSFSY